MTSDYSHIPTGVHHRGLCLRPLCPGTLYGFLILFPPCSDRIGQFASSQGNGNRKDGRAPSILDSTNFSGDSLTPSPPTLNISNLKSKILITAVTFQLRVMEAHYHHSIFGKMIPYSDFQQLQFTNHHSVGLNIHYA